MFIYQLTCVIKYTIISEQDILNLHTYDIITNIHISLYLEYVLSYSNNLDYYNMIK